MKWIFNKRIASTTLALLLSLLFTNCGNRWNPFSKASNQSASTIKYANIPVTLVVADDASSAFNLIPTAATNLVITVTDCTNTTTWGPYTLRSGGSIPLYTGDTGCIVKLSSFKLGAITYNNTGTGSIPFSTWTANSIATFAKTGSTGATGDLIKVYIESNVSTSGVSSSDTVVYRFTDVNSLANQNLLQTAVSYGGAISVPTQNAPAFTYVASGFNQINANGSASLWFTLQCSSLMTGSPNYRCANTLLKGGGTGGIDFILIPDAYSQGTLTKAQLDSAFVANSATAINTGQVAPAASDGHGNTLTNGGFVTAEASGGVNTGTTAISPSNLNYVLMIRARDDAGAYAAYLYFYVTLSSITQSTGQVSACSTTFDGGAGTVNDPYWVSSRTTLTHIGSCGSGVYFIQTNDIDLGGSGTPWTTLSTFSAQYNGAGYTISGLYISSAATSGTIGLLGTMNAGSSFSNSLISGASITAAAAAVGVLAGTNLGTIRNVIASGGTLTHNFSDAVANASAGGLVGTSTSATAFIYSSGSSVSVTSNVSVTTAGYISLGGLGGFLGTSGTVTDSFATGAVTVTGGSTGSYAAVLGSFSGHNAGTVINSYATGNVTMPTTSTASAFTLMGFIAKNNGVVSGSYAKGTYSSANNSNVICLGGFFGQIVDPVVTTSNNYTMATLVYTGAAGNSGGIGGFLGCASQTGASTGITSSYSGVPSITGALTTNTHGFIGNSTAMTVVGSYYYANASVPADTTSGLAPQTLAEMSTRTRFSNFEFASKWAFPLVNPLASPTTLLSPVARWQCNSNGIICDWTKSTLIGNGSFELGTYTEGGSGYQALTSGASPISDWALPVYAAGQAAYWMFTAWAPSSGTKSINLQLQTGGTASLVLSHAFGTVNGTTYTLYFDQAGHYGCANLTSNLTVSVNNTGATSQNYSFNATGRSATNMGWVTRTFTFTASAATTTISFGTGVTPTSCPVFDNVRASSDRYQ